MKSRIKHLLISFLFGAAIAFIGSIAGMILSGCGAKVTVDPVTVNHRVDFSTMIPYITAYCKDKFTSQQEIDDCVNLEIGKIAVQL